MTRLRTLIAIALASLPLAHCRSAPAVRRAAPLTAEALTDATTIRARCEDPEGVLSGRALCVLKDLPRGNVPIP